MSSNIYTERGKNQNYANDFLPAISINKRRDHDNHINNSHSEMLLNNPFNDENLKIIREKEKFDQSVRESKANNNNLFYYLKEDIEKRKEKFNLQTSKDNSLDSYCRKSMISWKVANDLKIPELAKEKISLNEMSKFNHITSKLQTNYISKIKKTNSPNKSNLFINIIKENSNKSEKLKNSLFNFNNIVKLYSFVNQNSNGFNKINKFIQLNKITQKDHNLSTSPDIIHLTAERDPSLNIPTTRSNYNILDQDNNNDSKSDQKHFKGKNLENGNKSYLNSRKKGKKLIYGLNKNFLENLKGENLINYDIENNIKNRHKSQIKIFHVFKEEYFSHNINFIFRVINYFNNQVFFKSEINIYFVLSLSKLLNLKISKYQILAGYLKSADHVINIKEQLLALLYKILNGENNSGTNTNIYNSLVFYKAFVGEGNNSIVIKTNLKNRFF